MYVLRHQSFGGIEDNRVVAWNERPELPQRGNNSADGVADYASFGNTESVGAAVAEPLQLFAFTSVSLRVHSASCKNTHPIPLRAHHGDWPTRRL